MVSLSLIALLIPSFCLIMVLYSFSLFGRGKLSWRELSVWLIMWIGISLVSLRPDLLDQLPEFIGIKSGVNALIFFGFIVLFYGLFRLFTKVEDLESKVVELNRRLALKDVQKDME